ncbi:MAG: DegV family protein [Thermoleophilia bacterium]|nr:DegV family protein [Thermoleophilia bacterium]
MRIDRTTTALVVDSTADLPKHLVEDPNVTLVPLTVCFGDECYLDWVELKPEEFYRKLAAFPKLPTTSQPPPGVWIETYQKLRERYERVYSVHLSAEFSGTCEAARAAAAQIDGVKVVDSRLATGGIALLVDRMVERIDRGVSEEEFEAYLDYFDRHKTFIFLPTTLDYLYKGGRIGRAAHLVGTLLNIKPVLEIRDGVADVYRKTRGLRQALEAMRDCLLERTSPGGEIYANLSHGLNEPVMERLEQLLLEVSDRRIHLRPCSIVGSVIGTYIGPGAVGLGFIQESPSGSQPVLQPVSQSGA